MNMFICLFVYLFICLFAQPLLPYNVGYANASSYLNQWSVNTLDCFLNHLKSFFKKVG